MTMLQWVIKELTTLGSGGAIENGNVTFGHCVQTLLDILRNNPQDADDSLEGVLLAALKANGRRLSSGNLHKLAYCFVYFYKSRSLPFWSFLSVITEEINIFSLSGVVVLGIMTREIGDGFKSQLPHLISVLVTASSVKLQPHVCQCFRRILKGTGKFLTGSINEVYNYVLRGSASACEPLRVECIKTIPVLINSAGIELQKLLPIINQSLSSDSHILRYAGAKSIAKVAFSLPISSPTKPFQSSFKFLLKMAQTERNVRTISSSFTILMRFYPPLMIVEHAKDLVKVVLQLTTTRVSLPSLAGLTKGLMDSIAGSAGDTICNTICASIIEAIATEPLTAANAVIALCVMIRYPVSSKTLAAAGRLFYPLLTTDRKDLRRLAVHFFATMSQTSAHKGKLFYQTFIDFLKDSDRASAIEIDGFSRAVACMITTTDVAVDDISAVTLEWLKQKRVDRITKALLIQAVIYKKTRGKDARSVDDVMQCIQTLLKSHAKDKEVVKFVGCYLLQVLMKPCANFDSYNQIYRIFASIVLANVDKYSSPVLLAFWRIMRNAQFVWNEKTSDIPQQMTRASIIVVSRFMTAEIADALHPYEGDTDILNTLYGIENSIATPKRIDVAVKTIFDYIYDTAPGARQQVLVKEVLNDFATWISITDSKTKAMIITEIFDSVKEKTLLSLSLIKSLLGRPKLSRFLPTNGLPIFLGLEATNKTLIMRYASACIGKWLKVFPTLANGCLAHLEKQGRSPRFVSFVFCDGVKAFEEVGRLLLKVHQMLQTKSLVAPLNALYAILKYGKLDEQSLKLTESVLLQCCFDDRLRNPVSLVLFTKCLSMFSSIDPTVVYSLLEFDTYRNLAMVLALSCMKKVSTKPDIQVHISQLQRINGSPRLYIESLHYTTSLENAPWMFTLLQQTGDASITENLIRLVDQDPDAKLWTDLCKRIVINKCVPPAERKGDSRIVPTSPVLIAAMSVVVRLIAKMRETFPLQLNCVDDIVSIAFNAIQMNDRKIDYHSFAILATVLRSFADVRNHDGSLLNIYTAQFHPMLVHALDNTRTLFSIADFCLSYIDFLEDSQSNLLNEAIRIVVDGLNRYNIEKGDFIVFCRLCGRVQQSEVFNPLRPKFVTIINTFFEKCAFQKFRISDLGEQLCAVTMAYTETPEQSRTITNKCIMLLLLRELESQKCASILATITALINVTGITQDEANFVLSIIASNMDVFEPKRDEIQMMTPTDEDDLDASNFWIVPKQKESSVSAFLTAVSANIPNGEWEDTLSYVLSLSLMKPFCFAALSHLLKRASLATLSKIAAPMVSSVLEDSDKYEAFCVQVFECVGPEIIDGLIGFISRANISSDRKYSLLRIGLRHCNNYEIRSMKELSEFVISEILPDGVTFVSSLLLVETTARYGLKLLSMGIIEAVVNAMVASLRSLPKVMHFLRICCEKVKQYGCDSKDFQRTILAIVFVALRVTINQTERAAVVSPACMIMKLLDADVMRERWENERFKSELLKVLEPPTAKRQTQIELKVFAGSRTRKTAASTGWQSLDIDDDE